MQSRITGKITDRYANVIFLRTARALRLLTGSLLFYT